MFFSIFFHFIDYGFEINLQKTNKMTFIFLHKCVRNDLHCPNCRNYYLSIYNSRCEAVESLRYYWSECKPDNDEEDYDKDLQKLDMDGSLWISEWERRGNGDKFNVVSINPMTRYDLGDLDYENSHGDNRDEIKYMLLNIKIDRDECCPDNFKYRTTFYSSLDELNLNYEDDLNYDGELNSKIRNFEPIWIPSDSSKNGNFYQLIEVQHNAAYHLNSYCDQLDGANSN